MVETNKKLVCNTTTIGNKTYALEGGNDWSIVAKKFVYGLIIAIIAVAIPYAINFLQTEDLSSLPDWFLPFVPVIVGILLAIQNAWAHRLKLVEVNQQ